MKKIALVLALLAYGFSFAQTEIINNYKYVIVPKKFDFFKEEDKFNMNTLTKKAFEKYGFEVYFDEEQYPPEVALNRCRTLYGTMLDDSNVLSTAVAFQLKDCSGKVLFTSEKGKSRIKEYQKAYYDAARSAAASLETMGYKYVGDAASAAYFAQAIPAGATATVVAPAPVPATPQTPAVTPTPVVNEATLFAQPIANGYQLVDSTPKVVLKIYKTSQPDSYTAVGDGKNGVVFKKGNEWFFEHYVNDKLVSEKLNIKF